MKGSILFNKDINIEVDVDPSAEEGARLISAKNLVDGQEAGGGGGDFTTAKVTFVINNVTVTDYSFKTVIRWPDPEHANMYEYRPQPQPSNTFDLLLYEGRGYISEIFAENSVATYYAWDHSAESINSITGDAEYDSESGNIIINGDCTINVDVVED